MQKRQTDRHLLSYIDSSTRLKPRLDGRTENGDKTWDTHFIIKYKWSSSSSSSSSILWRKYCATGQMISRRHRSQPFKSKLPLTIISHQRYHPRRHPCQNRPPPSWQCHQYHSGERNWSWGPAMGIMASKRRPIIPIQMVEQKKTKLLLLRPI